jgi:hypothetical protein
MVVPAPQGTASVSPAVFGQVLDPQRTVKLKLRDAPQISLAVEKPEAFVYPKQSSWLKTY